MQLEFSEYEWEEIAQAMTPEEARRLVLALKDADIPAYVEAPSVLTAIAGHITPPHRIYVPEEFVEDGLTILDDLDADESAAE